MPMFTTSPTTVIAEQFPGCLEGKRADFIAEALRADILSLADDGSWVVFDTDNSGSYTIVGHDDWLVADEDGAIQVFADEVFNGMFIPMTNEVAA